MTNNIVYDIGIYLGSMYNIDIEHDDGYTLIDETIPNHISPPCCPVVSDRSHPCIFSLAGSGISVSVE